MTPEEIERFDRASNHPYNCRCNICQEWWDIVGPEVDENDLPIDEDDPMEDR